MHIDPFSTLAFNAIGSLLMSAILFAVSRGYLGEIKAIIHYWIIALLLQGVGSVLTTLCGVIPDVFSMVIAPTFIALALALYFHALVKFKQAHVPLQWIYWIVGLVFVGHVYFILISFNLTAKIALLALCSSVLLFASGFLLLKKQPIAPPLSHRLTGGMFLWAALIGLIRSIYYTFWNIPVVQNIFHLNLIQDLTYLTAYITVIIISFGFVLMCNDRYLSEKNQAQSALQEALERLQKIASRVPGMVYQFRLNTNGSFSLPYSSPAIHSIFRISPEDVRDNADKIFAVVHPEDHEKLTNSILASAQSLEPWQYEFRTHFEDGTERWLHANSLPQREEDGTTLWHGFVTDITERKQIEINLQASEDRFRNLFDNAPLPYQSLDIQGNLVHVNQAWLELLGCKRNEVMGNFFGEFMTESSRATVYPIFARFKKEGFVSSPIFELIRRDTGEIRLVTVSGRIARDGQGSFQSTHCILTDVTEQYRVEQELKQSEQRFRQLIERLPLALSLTNDKNEIIFINERFKRTFGYTLDEIPVLKYWFLRAYPNKYYRKRVLKTWMLALERARCLGTDIEPMEYRVTCKDGNVRVMLISGIELDNCVIATFVDITERKAAEETIKKLAFYDALTQLPNRRMLYEKLAQSINNSRLTGNTFAVLMMDLDRFKSVNDTLGHSVGDELLQQVAERIKKCLRVSDLVARLGGDEFVILIEYINHHLAVTQCAESIILALTQPFILRSIYQVSIGVSIGVTLYPEHGDSVESLLDHADTALYRAKDMGRGCFAYFSE